MRRTLPILISAILGTASVDFVAVESPRCVRGDTLGRLFVGERDVLFVSEPNGPRKRLCQFPPNSIVKDIEVRGNDVYVLTLSALYVIPNAVRQRDNLHPKKLLWGIPRGHETQGFRALAWGPEGDLYCSFGNPHSSGRWGHWTFFSGLDGAKTPYNGVGGIVRCKPDGSDLRIVASGLRDPQAFAFDRCWNLFTSDLDTNKVVTMLRVTPRAYFGWPRNGVDPLPTVLDSQRPVPVADVRPLEPYDATEAAPEKLWRELSDPSWPRRYRAQIEMMRRGGAFLKQANKRLLDAKTSDPALHHPIWLAAKSQQGSLHLLSLVDHADPLVRVQTIRALTEFPEQLRDEPIFTKLLLDEHPQVQHAAMLAYFSPKIAWGRPVQFAIERGPACSTDPLLRQTATLLLAERATLQQLEALCSRFDAPLRMAGVLAAGYRLTLPAATKPLHAQLPLAKLPDESAYILEYADGKVDLRHHGRLGTFTVAEHWKADMHTDEQEALFKLLCKMLKDAEEPIRLQAARFLAILDDPRSAAEVGKMLKKDSSSNCLP